MLDAFPLLFYEQKDQYFRETISKIEVILSIFVYTNTYRLGQWL